MVSFLPLAYPICVSPWVSITHPICVSRLGSLVSLGTLCQASLLPPERQASLLPPELFLRRRLCRGGLPSWGFQDVPHVQRLKRESKRVHTHVKPDDNKNAKCDARRSSQSSCLVGFALLVFYGVRTNTARLMVR